MSNTLPKPVKISQYKNESTYRVGDWSVNVERKSNSTFSCGLRRTTSRSIWHAFNSTDGRKFSFESGGIKQAVEKLSKLNN
jgi:hypothetical protein